MTWTTRSIITKLTCATFSGAHLYVIHLISDLPSPSSSLVCSTAHWCPDAKCVCSSGLELKRCRKPHIRSHKIYTHTQRRTRRRVSDGLHGKKRSSPLSSCGTLHCTRMNPITSCHPAQQTAQCHEDCYGISHPALLCLIPLSDSFMNGINKLSRPVSRLHFSSQRNRHSVGVCEGPEVRGGEGLSEAFYQLLNARCAAGACTLH